MFSHILYVVARVRLCPDSPNFPVLFISISFCLKTALKNHPQKDALIKILVASATLLDFYFTYNTDDDIL
jgi:hypothetical protein